MQAKRNTFAVIVIRGENKNRKNEHNLEMTRKHSKINIIFCECDDDEEQKCIKKCYFLFRTAHNKIKMYNL